jgi:restriction endonuclease S subunit
MGLERGPLNLVSTTGELLDRKVAAPVYKTENTAVGIHHADLVAPSIRKKLTITSPTSSGRSVGVVRSRTQATEFSFSYIVFGCKIIVIFKVTYFGFSIKWNVFLFYV